MSGLTDEEILSKIAELHALRPNDPGKYMLESSTSKGGKRGTTTTKTQSFDSEGLAKAQKDFDEGPIGQQIAALQRQLGDRNQYRNSLFGRVAGPASYAGEILGGPLAYLTTPHGTVSPPGTSLPGRFANAGSYLWRAGAPLAAAYYAQKRAMDEGREPWDRDISVLAKLMCAPKA